MSVWHVRQEGSPHIIQVESPAEIAQGLRDGIWLPTDEVRGPEDPDWVRLESHPLFEEIAFDLEPTIIKPDDTHLDMNPLIDVCLVLLIFFILTLTYDSLRRAIEIPPEQAEQKGLPTVNLNEEKGIFKLRAYMEGEEPIILLEGSRVQPEQLVPSMKTLIERTGRKQMYLDVNGDVPWGLLTQIIDAAKGNGVHEILRKNAKP